jgi:hypothetical protein
MSDTLTAISGIPGLWGPRCRGEDMDHPRGMVAYSSISRSPPVWGQESVFFGNYFAEAHPDVHRVVGLPVRTPSQGAVVLPDQKEQPQATGERFVGRW